VQTVLLTRDAILASDDRKIEKVEVPEWGGHLFVKSLTGRERDEFELSMLEGKGKNQEVNLRNLRARLVAKTAVDSDDWDTAKPIFQPADIQALGEKNAAALQRVYAKAQELSGLTADEIDEMTTELGNAQGSDSGTDSPSQPVALMSGRSKTK
jgi:hypothetical protein